MHKVFISFHHQNDQWAKDELCRWNEENSIFIDKSVDTDDIDDALSSETIRIKIRDEYLRDSTVTILLVGTETRNRKHIDWELYSSMRDGPINKKSGILVVLLPSVTKGNRHIHAGHGDDEKRLYPQISQWTSTDSYSNPLWGGYDYLPGRILDNLKEQEVKISITTWDNVYKNQDLLVGLIDLAHRDRAGCQYDLSRPMRRKNS